MYGRVDSLVHLCMFRKIRLLHARAAESDSVDTKYVANFLFDFRMLHCIPFVGDELSYMCIMVLRTLALTD